MTDVVGAEVEGPKRLRLGAEVSSLSGRSVFVSGLGAEAVGTEVVGAEVSKPPWKRDTLLTTLFHPLGQVYSAFAYPWGYITNLVDKIIYISSRLT